MCHLGDKAKPRQMNSAACDCLKCGGDGIYSFTHLLDTDTTNVPFQRQGHRVRRMLGCDSQGGRRKKNEKKKNLGPHI